MPNFPKTFTGIVKDEIEALEGTQITNTAPGTIARAILEIPAATIAGVYTDMNTASLNSFLSTAKGDYLNRIGFLVGVDRLQGESDLLYRSRIHDAVPMHAKANGTSIRSVAEAVPGVSAISLLPGTFGPGSFTVLVHPNRADEIEWSVLTAVDQKISDVVAYGTKYDVVPVQFNDVNVSLTAVVSKNLQNVISSSAIENAISGYILGVPAGGILSVDGMKVSAVNTIGPNNIVTITIDKIYINGKQISGNYIAAEDEAFTPNRFEDRPIKVSIRQ